MRKAPVRPAGSTSAVETAAENSRSPPSRTVTAGLARRAKLHEPQVKPRAVCGAFRFRCGGFSRSAPREPDKLAPRQQIRKPERTESRCDVHTLSRVRERVRTLARG